MRSDSKVFFMVAGLCLVTLGAPVNAVPAPHNDTGTIVIVLKNGNQQSFNLADVARIEFNQPTNLAAAPGRARFYGDWTVGDGTGSTFVITLKPDGSAHKTAGSGSGKWTLVDGAAQIAWDDGWHDVIRREGSKYQKAAYSPGTSLSGKPNNVTDARKHAEVN